MSESTGTDSSCCTEVGYDFSSRELVIVFPSGETYIYYDVDRFTFGAFVASSSMGSYFNTNIKNKFNYEKN